MSGNSKIEWTEATWNPVTGCTKVSQGCKNCYALREWPRLSAPRPKPNVYTGRQFTDVMCHPERLDQPLHWKKPRRIFVNSMSDLFHDAVPFEFIFKVFAIMALAQNHTFQILTKRPDRMLRFLTSTNFNCENAVKGMAYQILGKNPKYSSAGMRAPWPLPNVWLGVSCEDQETADERIPLLLDTPDAVRWISAEPLLGSISLEQLSFGMGNGNYNALALCNGKASLDWVVVGGESGPKARPMHCDWVRSIRDQCQAAGVPFFMKQMWGKTKKAMPPIPQDLMIREYPDE